MKTPTMLQYSSQKKNKEPTKQSSKAKERKSSEVQKRLPNVRARDITNTIVVNLHSVDSIFIELNVYIN